ncbi:hypothetical protein L596_023136 [Steinernema carpocapsae]|uniref:Uncharacterized protein n=1 Tax=Steinernema carpocapsae TaxID=34508 RepID=A0A4U5MCR5_STECR|nr:hypothetical protein L596_023136 [Steinernema carpocapsae]
MGLLSFFFKTGLLVVSLFTGMAVYTLQANCRGEKLFLPGTKGFCKDMTTLYKDRVIPDTLRKNTDAAFQQVFMLYAKEASAKYKTISASPYMKTAESYAQVAHTHAVDGFLKVQRHASGAWKNVDAWYKKDGQKIFGGFVENVKIGSRMAIEMGRDIGITAWNHTVAAAHWTYDAAIILVNDPDKFVQKVRSLYS